jgi:thymidylate synthase
MKQYQSLLQNILDNGKWQNNRTGIRTKMIDGAMFRFDMSTGLFPLLTTKKMAFQGMAGELIAFLRGCDTAEQFRELGCKWWDANSTAPAWVNNPAYQEALANGRAAEDGYLGRIYGKQWRDWRGAAISVPDTDTKYEGCVDPAMLEFTSSSNVVYQVVDQIANLLEQIKNNPTSRRLLVSAWRPDEVHAMALPPCHYGFQVIIEQETHTMHLLWNQRSVDTLLGLPMNIASYALLLKILSQITGYNPGNLTGFLADVHIYENHMEQVQEQLSREPYALPSVALSSSIIEGYDIDMITPQDFELIGYKCHAALPAPMAV